MLAKEQRLVFMGLYELKHLAYASFLASIFISCRSVNQSLNVINSRQRKGIIANA